MVLFVKLMMQMCAIWYR